MDIKNVDFVDRNTQDDEVDFRILCHESLVKAFPEKFWKELNDELTVKLRNDKVLFGGDAFDMFLTKANLT